MEKGISRWISHWASRQPDRTVLVFGEQRLTWREFDERVTRLAHGLRGLDVGRGDRVVCLMYNRPEFLELFWAVQRLGAIFVPVNVRLAPPELEYVLRHVEPKVICTESAFAELVVALPPVPGIWLTADDGPLPVPARAFRDLREENAPEPIEVPVTLDDPAVIMYTSGTTGFPKGAIVTHGNIHFQTLNWILGFGLGRADRHLAVMPLCFTGGLLCATMNAFHSGATLVLERDFDAARAIGLVERERITWITAVPTMCQRILHHPDATAAALSSLRNMETGGSPMPIPLLEKARSYGVGLVQGYGLTEGTGGVSLFMTSDDGIRKAGSCGRLPLYGDAKVVLENGEPAGPGETGELLISGPLVVAGYWKDPQATARAIMDGWLHTGDLARYDDEGYFSIVGRRHDMIISGGLNVYPVEVEQVIETFPEVAEVAVVGLPDPDWGEAVTAYIVLRPGAELSEAEARARCRGRLADYKIPKRVLFAVDLPRTVSGKILKRALRQTGGTSQGAR